MLALGLGLRAFHYLRDPSVWHDEAAPVLNVLHKGYAEFWGPRYYVATEPPLFLCAEKAVVGVLGDSTFALRLLPVVASCLGLILGFLAARRFLAPVALFWLLLLFACSDRLLWHACEAKVYSTDVLIATGLLLLFARRGPGAGSDDLARRVALTAATTPLLVFASYPASFLLGAAALVWLPDVWRARRQGLWAAYALFAILLVGSFTLLATGPAAATSNGDLRSCWAYIFPDWQRSWAVPGLAVQRLSEVFRYASEPVGNVLAVFAIMGGVALWRSGQKRLLAFMTLPLALAGTAWLLGRYPLGPARTMAFAAPACLALIAPGLPPAFAWFARRRGGPVVLAGLLLFPLGQAAFRVVVPWDRTDSKDAVALVLNERRADEPVVGCLLEHTYYFRGLGPDYRKLNRGAWELPSPPPTAAAATSSGDGFATRLWLVDTTRGNVPQENLARLEPAGRWRVEREHAFRNVSVYSLRLSPESDQLSRRSPNEAGAPSSAVTGTTR